MKDSYPAFEIDRIVPLADDDYYWFVRDRIARAQRRVWLSMFVIDVRRAYDPELHVRSLVQELRRASFNGVQVRVLTGDSRRVIGLREMNMVSRSFMLLNRLSTKQHGQAYRSSTHEKYILFDDDLAVLGSHNWLDESFNHAAELSVAVQSRDVVRQLEGHFLEAWKAPLVKPRANKKAPSKPVVSP